MLYGKTPSQDERRPLCQGLTDESSGDSPSNIQNESGSDDVSPTVSVLEWIHLWRLYVSRQVYLREIFATGLLNKPGVHRVVAVANSCTPLVHILMLTRSVKIL